jgi:hypothetical protein
MNFYAIEHILKRCIILLKRASGSDKTKQEYYYWISWLKNEFKKYKNLDENSKNKIKIIIIKNKYLQDDIGIKFN